MREPDLPHATSSAPERGVQRIWFPGVWGTIVGAIGATVFVLANRGALPAPWSMIALFAWLAALVAYVFTVFVRPRDFAEFDAAAPRAGLVYVASVVGMIVLIRVGSALLPDGHVDERRPALIVIAVGLHFLPFAKAFHTPMFTVLGSLMFVIGAVGLGLGWWWTANAAAASAVVAGVAMLFVIAADAARSAQHGPDKSLLLSDR